MKGKQMCRKYSAKENKSFWRQVNSGKPAGKIRIRGRKRECVWRKLRELGLTIKRGFPALTRTQRIRLRELIARGFRAKQIAEHQILGQSEHLTNQNYIQKWMGKLGLVNKNRSRAAKKRRILTPAESRGLNRFVVLHSHELSAKQIAKKYKVKPETISSRQRQLGVKPSLRESVRLPATRRKFLSAMRKKSRQMLANYPAHIANLEKKLHELAQKIRGNHEHVPIEEKLCHKCKRSWPRHTAFFFHREYRFRKGTGVSLHFSGPCKICMSKMRHQKRL